MISIQARDAYNRDLQLHQRIGYVSGLLLVKVWYLAQIIPPPPNIRQNTTAKTWFIWRGDKFIVSLATLYKPKHQGRWGIINKHVKCRALLIYRMLLRVKETGSLTARLLEICNLTTPRPNPWNRNNVPQPLVHLQLLESDSVHITKPHLGDSDPEYNNRLYSTQHSMLQAGISCERMWIERIWTATRWNMVWKNLWATPGPDFIKARWYRAICDILNNQYLVLKPIVLLVHADHHLSCLQ